MLQNLVVDEERHAKQELEGFSYFCRVQFMMYASGSNIAKVAMLALHWQGVRPR